MVRAAVSASQASLERSGSAPAPCPQAEPRPEAEKRHRDTQEERVQVARVQELLAEEQQRLRVEYALRKLRKEKKLRKENADMRASLETYRLAVENVSRVLE